LFAKSQVINMKYVILSTMLFLFLISCSDNEIVKHDTIIGKPDIKFLSEDLKSTVVSPFLDIDFKDGENVIFCADFQMAWSEMKKNNGGPIDMDEGSTFVAKLNNPAFTERDIDSDIYFAISGIYKKNTLKIIDQRLKGKFKGQSSPSIFPSQLPEGSLFAYSYLFSNLPFEWAFERLDAPLFFRNKKVQSFGIYQYDPRRDKMEKRSGKQVKIYDLDKNNGVIVELITEKKDHRLILAKVKSQKNLLKMVKFVMDKIDAKVPRQLCEMEDLMIPVFNFEILKNYKELCYKSINSSIFEIDQQYFTFAIQNIRFRMDERGAIIKSESWLARCVSEDLIFDDAFLVMLTMKDAEYPYFAMWVDNPELMLPFE
jgi:hypothetical protein